MKGHIRERSPGHWAIILDAANAATGKRKRRWHSFEGTKRQAQVECSRLISEKSSGTYLEPSKLTIAQFLEHWLGHIKARVSPRTHERYGEIVRKNIIPTLGSVALTKLRPAQIADAYTKALAGGRRDGTGGLSPNTHRIIKQALAHAVRWQMVIRNPADAVDPPKVERGAMTTYDMGQTAELLDTVRGTRLFVPVLLGVMCGLRRGEIAALRWRSVDLAGAQLAIVQSAEQTREGVRYKERTASR
jgi:integrase